MTTRLNWGIISTGQIAATFAAALRVSETGRLLAVASRCSERAEAFGSQWGAERRYASYDGLLADRDVQAVYIATPHPQHAEWAIKAAEAGKHVLCEKPCAVNEAGWMAMMEAARRGGVFLMEAFMYRCHPQTARLAELIRSSAIGEVQMIQATFGFRAGRDPSSRLYSNALAGGGILDVGCYTASMARLVAGCAVGKTFEDPVEVKGTACVGPTGVDEWAAASLRFPSGILAQLVCGVGLSMENDVRISGTGGRIVLPNPWQANRRRAEPVVIRVHRSGSSDVEEIVAPAEATAFVYEADVVGRAVFEGRRQAAWPAMSWDDTTGNMRTLDAWRQTAGVQFQSETPGHVATVSGRPLSVRSGGAMKFGSVAGIDKPVSRLVMGCDNQARYPHACVMFDDFIERGGNCFDTAHIYGGGLYERHLGAWMQDRGMRSRVVVIGKGAHTPYCYPEIMGVQLRESLDRLRTDYVDLYLMHRDNTDVPVGEFVEAMNAEMRAGRMRAFGGSNWGLDRVVAANAYARERGLTGFAAVSNNFSLARMIEPVWGGCMAASDATSRAWFEQNRVPLFAWSSQARGFFTDRSAPDKREDKELVRCWYSDDNFERKKRVMELARRKGATPIGVALAYVLGQSFPTFALIGPRVLSETSSSMDALTVAVSADERRWLNLELESL